MTGRILTWLQGIRHSLFHRNIRLSACDSYRCVECFGREYKLKGGRLWKSNS